MVGSRMFKFMILLVMALAVYHQTFSAPFIFDDTNNILQNVFLFKMTSFFDLWNASFLTEWSRLRMVGYLSFALNYLWSGLDVFSYHVVNFLIHYFNGILVFFLCVKIQDLFGEGDRRSRELVSFFAAAIFLLHPLQTQAVTYIVQRFTSLSAFFYLSAFLSYVHARFYSSSVQKKLLYSVIFFTASVLGCLTKENFFSLFFMIIFFEFIFSGHSSPDSRFRPFAPKRIFLLAVPVMIVFLALAYHLNIFNRLQTALVCASDEGKVLTAWTYFLTQPRVIVQYMALLVLPIHQNFDYEFRMSETLLDPSTAGSFIFIAVIIGLAVSLWKKKAIFSFLIFWFFIALSIESTIFPIEDLIFEHRVYLSMFAFVLGVAILLTRIRKFYLGVFLLAAYVVFFSILAFQRNHVWRDPVVLWQDVVAKSPNKSRVRHNFGEALYASGQEARAIEEYHAALRINSCSSFTNNNLALIYWEQGLLDQAKQLFDKELECDRTGAFAAHNNLGMMYADQGMDEQAVESYEKAIAINPYWVEPYANLGSFYERKKDYRKAKQFFRKASEMFPHNMAMLMALVRVCLADGDDQCIDQSLIQTMNARGDAEKYLEIVSLVALEGPFSIAKKGYEKVMMLFPKTPQSYVEYGKFLANYNIFDAAIAIWERAQTIFPAHAEFSQLAEKARALQASQK